MHKQINSPNNNIISNLNKTNKQHITKKLSPQNNITRVNLFKNILKTKAIKIKHNKTPIKSNKQENYISKDQIIHNEPIKYGAYYTQNINLLKQSHNEALEFVTMSGHSPAECEQLYELIKKFVISVDKDQKEACFHIEDGLFANTQFFLRCDNNKLSLIVNSASAQAKNLLVQEKAELTARLHMHEINLHSLLFIS